ncbi:MAG: hypothetical protein ACFCVH_13855 [Alphaproteobacteria bacterium]
MDKSAELQQLQADRAALDDERNAFAAERDRVGRDLTAREDLLKQREHVLAVMVARHGQIDDRLERMAAREAALRKREAAVDDADEAIRRRTMNKYAPTGEATFASIAGDLADVQRSLDQLPHRNWRWMTPVPDGGLHGVEPHLHQALAKADYELGAGDSRVSPAERSRKLCAGAAA